LICIMAASAASGDEWSNTTEGKVPMSYATIMVHVDVERDSEQRVQLALGLADRLEATLIGVAGLALRPAFSGGGVVVFGEPTGQELSSTRTLFDQAGKKFRTQGQSLKQVEWRTALELPSELLIREARAADLIIVGPRHGGRSDPVDPGVILLRAGRPVLVVPDVVAPLALRRVIVAWKDTRECRRAVRDALPLLQLAREVLLFTAGEDEARSHSRDRRRQSVAAGTGAGRGGDFALRPQRECRSDRRRRLWAQPPRRMDLRRRHARPSHRPCDVLHAGALSLQRSANVG
jgi:nucleotide-binding universal stress UspA family protein